MTNLNSINLKTNYKKPNYAAQQNITGLNSRLYTREQRPANLIYSVGLPVSIGLALTGCIKEKDTSAVIAVNPDIPMTEQLQEPIPAKILTQEYIKGQNIALNKGNINECYNLITGQKECIHGFNDQIRINTAPIVNQETISDGQQQVIPQNPLPTQPNPIPSSGGDFSNDFGGQSGNIQNFPQDLQQVIPQNRTMQANRIPPSGGEFNRDFGGQSGNIQNFPQDPQQVIPQNRTIPQIQPPMQSNPIPDPSSNGQFSGNFGGQSGNIQSAPEIPQQEIPQRSGIFRRAIIAMRNFLQEDGIQQAINIPQGNNIPFIPQQTSPTANIANIEDACENALPSVVTVDTGGGAIGMGMQGGGGGIGSGSIVDPSGLVITNNHVVGGTRNVTVKLTDQTEKSGTVIATDEQNDLALIQLEPGTYSSISLNSQLPAAGEELCAVGSPYGKPNTITSGTYTEINPEGHMISEVELHPGNSGGPLINIRGEQVGVNKGIADEQMIRSGQYDENTSFATKASIAKQFIEQNSR